MRFRFLGDGDCPDWLLTEINTLSRMTSIKMKTLGQLVAKSLTEGEFDEEKVKKLAQDAKIELSDAKAAVAALEFILTSSTRYGVSPGDLSSELQQLGLPREHSAAIARLHTDNSSQLTVTLTAQSLRLSRLSSVEVPPRENESPLAKLTLKMQTVGGEEDGATLNIVKEDVPILLAELKRARSLMEEL